MNLHTPADMLEENASERAFIAGLRIPFLRELLDETVKKALDPTLDLNVRSNCIETLQIILKRKGVIGAPHALAILLGFYDLIKQTGEEAETLLKLYLAHPIKEILDIMCCLANIIPQNVLERIIPVVEVDISSSHMPASFSALLLLASLGGSREKSRTMLTFARGIWLVAEKVGSGALSPLSYAFSQVLQHWLNCVHLSFIVKARSRAIIKLLLRWLQDGSDFILLPGTPWDTYILSFIGSILFSMKKRIIPLLPHLLQALLTFVGGPYTLTYKGQAVVALGVLAAASGSAFAPYTGTSMNALAPLLRESSSNTSVTRGEAHRAAVKIFKAVGATSFKPYLAALVDAVLLPQDCYQSLALFRSLVLLTHYSPELLIQIFSGDALHSLFHRVTPAVSSYMLVEDGAPIF
ncbi:hypothetical protein NLJ89_g11213 [Agrocybe chaxingu]|uniref:Uncharacterized protein n=1 Tax=Agrocybe chaxingu TaxID=84603 RepID=A0A9W8JX75_9AGAR|nr:hypothetical protein NLJ89_g11213 [Agrocybe chaxingu]